MNRGLKPLVLLCFFLTSSTVIAGPTTLVSGKSPRKPSNGASSEPSVSDTGRFVAFLSPATNLVAARCNNGFNHIFVRDRTAGTTRCVSVHSNGAEGNGDSFDPSISSNGQMVVFHSSATNLTNRCTNGNSHVYVHDLTTGQTRCVSVDSSENESNGNSDLPRISGDGLFVAFESDATNLTSQCNNAFTQIFVRDLTNGRTTCASMDNNENQGNNDSVQPSISSDGQLVAFSSVATNLTTIRCITGNKQVFVRDRTDKKTTCASVDSKKREGNGDSVNPLISGNGDLVTFESTSNNLVRRDTNGILDVFAHVLP